MSLAVYTRKVVYGGIGGDALVLTRRDLLPVLNLFKSRISLSQVKFALVFPGHPGPALTLSLRRAAMLGMVQRVKMNLEIHTR